MQFNRFSPLPLILSIAAPLLGQQTTATLVGTITDSSSSSLVRTQVSVRNLQTNLTRETQTDDTGNYTVPFLPASGYALFAKMRSSKSRKCTSRRRADGPRRFSNGNWRRHADNGGAGDSNSAADRKCNSWHDNRFCENRGTSVERTQLRPVGPVDSWRTAGHSRIYHGAPWTRLDWAE